MYLDKKAILESLTKEDVEKVVVALGSQPPKHDSNGNLIFQSVCHGSDSWKLYYYHESDETKNYKGRTFHCYSHCSDSFSIIELVIRAKRAQGVTITWYKALYFVAQITGKVISTSPEAEEKNHIIDDFEWINRLKRAKKRNKSGEELESLNENILEIFYYAPHEDWLNNNITQEVMSVFEIGYWGECNAITIPHRYWKDGSLVGLRLRHLSEDDIEKFGKYHPAQIEGKILGYKQSLNLYGLHLTKDKILTCKKIMLVEAEKSVMQAYSYFGDDCFCAATCGSSLTIEQIQIILNELKVDEVIYAPDRDYHEANSFEAEAWFHKQVLKLAPLVPYVKVFLLADNQHRLGFKDSPTDNGKDILLELMEEKIEITTEVLNRVREESKKHE